MVALLCFVFAILVLPFKARSRLEAENAALRHQLIVLRRQLRGRVRLSNNDRLFFIQLYRWFPSILKVLTIVRPETSVVVHPTGRNYPTWECATQVNKPDNPNYQLSAACRHTLDLIVGRLQSIYDLAG